jgi:5-methylcytosine-specific restriction protein A
MSGKSEGGELSLAHILLRFPEKWGAIACGGGLGGEMLILVEDVASKQMAQEAMERTVTAALTSQGKQRIGHRGRKIEHVVYSNGNDELWCAFMLDEDAATPRRWNAFGVFNSSGDQTITVEINIPSEEDSARVAGFFARDPATERIYLMHGGRVGGGKRGVGRDKFLAWSKEPLDDVKKTDGTKRAGIVVGDIAAEDLPSRLWRFVRLVKNFKDGVSPRNVDDEEVRLTIAGPQDIDLPQIGAVLANDEITSRFRVGNMGGMRRNSKANLLVLISDPFKGLYQDRWENGVLHYTGMGKVGHQTLSGNQNLTLFQSRDRSTHVHLFEAFEPQKYTYSGEFVLVDEPYQDEQLDAKKSMRKVWMFPIALKETGVLPEPTSEQARQIEESLAKAARILSDEALKARAKRARKQPGRRTAHTTIYLRDPAVAETARRGANGLCDLCASPAPFKNKKKEPYLECHHIVWLARGGEDSIENTVALCPNCHRKMHVVNEKLDRERLRERAASRA